MKSRFISNDEGCDQAAADIEYAASIRTKDLTDDEITNAWESMGRGLGKYTEFARAVIAADREKNK